ncbi:tyrosine-type recombinase/integrase [Novosphingobium rosa]|uniref:tyrosine-type recombinase/integrase n=1 Tax=Novosphingobium rosa TaxID=76978 RepID=UPI00082C970E|nr:site-specific integrase [Novosphingobium rosa]
MGKLTTIKVKTAKPGQGADGKPTNARLSDGAGLSLLIKPTGAKSWVLRVQVDGKSRDIGLGNVEIESNRAFGDHDPLAAIPLMQRTSLTLAEAREKAAALRKLAKAGADPVAERDKERQKAPTFTEAMNAAHEALKAGWGDKTEKAFLSSLKDHAVPKLGSMKVGAIGASDIVLALAPIWNEKPEIARKVRSRIGQVLAFAKARGWRTEALPDARELRSGLSKQRKGGNFAAMPFADIPTFILSEVAKELGVSRAAFLFTVLTAARSVEVRKATWEQIDLEAREWRRPPGIMKMKVPHVVTLNDAAVELLKRLTPDKKMRTGLIFPGAKAGKPLSDMSLTKILRLAERDETVHGFRSSFRDWAAEKMPTVPAMVAEMALAHRVGTVTEQAYLRSDLRDMRRALMDGWGRFVAPELSGTGDNVVSMDAAKRSTG